MEKYTTALSKIVMTVGVEAVNNFTIFMRDAQDCPLSDEQKQWVEDMAKKYLESYGKKPAGKKKAVTDIEDSPAPGEEAAAPAVAAKPKRAPTAYNLFIKDALLRVKQDNPGVNHKEAMKLANGLWKQKQEDDKNAVAPGKEAVAAVDEVVVERDTDEEVVVEDKEVVAPEEVVVEDKKKKKKAAAPEVTEEVVVEDKKKKKAAAVPDATEDVVVEDKKKKKAAAVPDATEDIAVEDKKKKKKAVVVEAEDDVQKKAPSEYNVFVKEMMPKIKEEFPGIARTEMMKIVGERWKQHKADGV